VIVTIRLGETLIASFHRMTIGAPVDRRRFIVKYEIRKMKTGANRMDRRLDHADMKEDWRLVVYWQDC
jgi:hypothetical protein